MTVVGFILLCVGLLVMFLFVLYSLVGVWSLPFYFLGFLYKLVFFPINIIDQYIYPVGVLPHFVLLSALFFFFAKLFMYNSKKIISLKPEDPISSKKK